METRPEVKARSPRAAKEKRQRSIKQFGTRFNIAMLERVGLMPCQLSLPKGNVLSLPQYATAPATEAKGGSESSGRFCHPSPGLPSFTASKHNNPRQKNHMVQNANKGENFNNGTVENRVKKRIVKKDRR